MTETQSESPNVKGNSAAQEDALVAPSKAAREVNLEGRLAKLETRLAELSGNSRIQTICFFILTVVALGVMAFVLRDVLIPFVFSVFLTFVLNPVVRLFIYRLRFPRVLAILVTIFLSLCLLVGLASFLSTSILQLTNETGNFSANISNLIDNVFDNEYVREYGINKEATMEAAGVKLADGAGQVISVLVGGVFSLCSNTVVVAIYLMFLLFGSNHDQVDVKSKSVWAQISHSVESYIFIKTVLSGFMAALTWLILASLGVKMASVIALMAFACNFIPNIGPIVASLSPIPIMLLSGQSDIVDLALAVALPGLIHFVVGHLLEPKLMGKSLDLDPVVILLGLMLFEVLWGPVGMLLAMPLMVVARILLDQTDFTRPLVDVMSGKLPGTEEAHHSEPPK